MNTKPRDPLHRNSVFGWIALATGVLLLIPLIAMQYSEEVVWDETDFIVMGILLFGMGSVFVLLSRRAPRRNRLFIGFGCAAVFLYVWAELAVGIFTTLGS